MPTESKMIRRMYRLSVVSMIFRSLGLLLLLIYIIVALALASSKGGQGHSPDEGALRIAINGSIVDQKTASDLFSSVFEEDQPQEYLLRDLIRAIQFAKDDDKINSIVLVLHKMQSTGISKIEELGVALEDFKTSGKPVFAVADSYSQGQYLLASYADKILMHPMGAVELFGLSSYQLYLADALEKLGVQVHVFRTGPHKSAVEPLIANAMGDEAREQSKRLLDDLWLTMKDGILARRQLTAASLDRYTNELDQLMTEGEANIAEIALELGLVDHIASREDVMDILQETAGIDEENDFYNRFNALPYLATQENTNKAQEGRIGLIVAKGTIQNGVQPAGTIGGDSLSFQLRKARLDKELDALVVRVDSPGGSAFASEVIRQQIQRFRDQDIPVFISMGSVAASGGYWISAPANEIWATPTTITGSIGAFAALPTIEETLAKAGLNSDGVETGPLAGALSIERPLGSQAKVILQTRIDNLYGDFLELVAEGRDMTVDTVDPIAGGRVWTGKQALELGLVDHLGDLNDVLAAAATAADLGESYQVVMLEKPLSPAEMFAKWIQDNVGISLNMNSGFLALFNASKRPIEQVTEHLELLSDPENMYLHCGLCEWVEAR